MFICVIELSFIDCWLFDVVFETFRGWIVLFLLLVLCLLVVCLVVVFVGVVALVCFGSLVSIFCLI